MDPNSSTEAIYENAKELEKGMKEKSNCSFHLLLLLLGILSVLLLVSIATIVWISFEMMNHMGAMVNLKKDNKRLLIKGSLLENVTEQLIMERDDLKAALQVILMYDNFPVNEFCPDKKCLPCQTSWTSFLGRCGQKGARLYCQNTSADLVVMKDLEELNLVTNREMNFCSLGQTDRNWFWIEGHNESLGFWMTGVVWYSGPYAMVITWWKFTVTLFSPISLLGNSFNCETEAVSIFK